LPRWIHPISFFDFFQGIATLQSKWSVKKIKSLLLIRDNIMQADRTLIALVIVVLGIWLVWRPHREQFSAYYYIPRRETKDFVRHPFSA